MGGGWFIVVFFPIFVMQFYWEIKRVFVITGPLYKNFHYIWFIFHSLCCSEAKEFSTYNWNFITTGYNIMRFWWKILIKEPQFCKTVFPSVLFMLKHGNNQHETLHCVCHFFSLVVQKNLHIKGDINLKLYIVK